MSKKKVLIHSNFCRAFTGFGKNKKNIMRYLFDTGKYELIELANGLQWSDPQTYTTPWTCRGTLPPPNQLQGLTEEQQRAESYGSKLVDQAILEFKPDVYIGMEDIWAVNNFHNKPWWNKINTFIWTTLDSLPLLPEAVSAADKIKHYYVWASFAVKELQRLGHKHVDLLRGCLKPDNFFKIDDQSKSQLR